MSRLPNLPYHRHLVQITPNSFASAAYTVHDMRTYAKAAIAKAVAQRVPTSPVQAAEIDRLTAEVAHLHAEYGEACRLVAAMHAAAMGVVTGPVRGVVEDVAALRTECGEMKKVAEGAFKTLAEASKSALLDPDDFPLLPEMVEFLVSALRSALEHLPLDQQDAPIALVGTGLARVMWAQRNDNTAQSALTAGVTH